MNSRTWMRVKTLLAEAAELPLRERERLVRERCNDPAVREELLQLVADPISLSGLLNVPALTSGTTIGPYVVDGLIGRGGMGEVYRARDTRLGREVALKVLPPALAADPDRLARLEREARLLASLNHPNIAQVYGLEDAAGTRALVMELVEGETLADRIARGAIPLVEALPMARQICEALEAAHQRGIIHRDLKPANVEVRPDGTVKILDFGLAKIAEPSAIEPANSPIVTATQHGMIIGTAAYMSPEQAAGKAVDRRSDLWSLGVVLMEMLTGRRVFAGETATQVIAAVLTTEPEWGSLSRDTPDELARFLHRCLEKDPRRRLDSAAAARLEVDEIYRRTIRGATTGHSMVDPRSMRLLTGRFAVSAVLGAAALLIASSTVWRTARHLISDPTPAPPSTLASIAVLPFANLTGEKDQEFFSDGLSEELIGLLGRVSQLRVVGRTSSFAFKGKSDDIRSIARQLSVRSILEGSVRRSGRKLRVSTELVNGVDGYQIWAETYDRDIADVFAIQDDIATQVVAALRVRLTSGVPLVSQHRTASPDAYNEYLLGEKFFWHENGDGYQRSADAYERAVRLDPNYAAAYVGLSRSLTQLGDFIEDDTLRASVQRHAVEAAERSIKLSPELGEAYSARANVRTYILRDWHGAEEDFQKALALDAGDWATYAHRGRLLARLGRLPEAIASLHKAADIEPLNPGSKNMLGLYLCANGQRAEARQVLGRALEIAPRNEYAQYFLGLTELADGRAQQALAVMAGTSGPWGGEAITAIAQEQLGNHEAARRSLTHLVATRRKTAPYHIAEAYAGLGELDEAFIWLDRAYVARDSQLALLKVDPLMAPVRRDPRYAAMVAKLGLPFP